MHVLGSKVSVDTFSIIEKLLKLPENTIKIGIMDEEEEQP